MRLSSGTRSIQYHRPGYLACDGYHRTDHASSSWISDPQWGGFGWYRFMKPAGTMMPTSPPPLNRCLTQMPGWLRNGHPSKKGQRNESALFCFNSIHSTCRRHAYGKVTNCGSFFVYYLSNAPVCHARYCAV